MIVCWFVGWYGRDLQLVEVELIVACDDVRVCRDSEKDIDIESAETERDFSFLSFSIFCSLFRMETGGVEGDAFACLTLDFHASTELSVFCDDSLVLVPKACEDIDSAEIERDFSFSFLSLFRRENETGGVEGETFSLSTVTLALALACGVARARAAE